MLKQQPSSDERLPLSQRFAQLSMLYDLAPSEMFDEELVSLQLELTAELCLQAGKGSVMIRHIAKEDGRQRFVVFINGKQFDHFDFSATEVSGFGLDDDETDLDDPGFQPFDA